MAGTVFFGANPAAALPRTPGIRRCGKKTAAPRASVRRVALLHIGESSPSLWPSTCIVEVRVRPSHRRTDERLGHGRRRERIRPAVARPLRRLGGGRLAFARPAVRIAAVVCSGGLARHRGARECFSGRARDARRLHSGTGSTRPCKGVWAGGSGRASLGCAAALVRRAHRRPSHAHICSVRRGRGRVGLARAAHSRASSRDRRRTGTGRDLPHRHPTAIP